MCAVASSPRFCEEGRSKKEDEFRRHVSEQRPTASIRVRGNVPRKDQIGNDPHNQKDNSGITALHLSVLFPLHQVCSLSRESNRQERDVTQRNESVGEGKETHTRENPRDGQKSRRERRAVFITRNPSNMSSGPSDELVSQFMAFSGCTDGERAKSYLEMSGGNVDVAVSLFMEHSTGGGGGAGGGVAGGAGGDGPGIPDVRAPDRTRTMRLMDDGPSAMMMGGVGGGLPGYMSLDDTMMNTFADLDARRAVDNAAARAERGSRRSNPGSSRNTNDDDGSGDGRARSNDSSGHEDDDHDGDIEEEEEEIEYHDVEDMQVSQDDEENKENGADGVASPKLSDIFAPPTHLMYRAGGFQSARTVAKDSKRWLLVNIQRDSEFSSHALNRDVWRDELVENLVREGFILWQVVRVESVVVDQWHGMGRDEMGWDVSTLVCKTCSLAAFVQFRFPNDVLALT